MARTYTMTVGGLVTKARAMDNDARTEMGYRAEDPEFIGWLNDAVNAMVPLFPGLFTNTIAHACAAGYLQILEDTRAVSFVGVDGLPEGDANSLTDFYPGWTVTANATPREFMRVMGDPLRFMVYPPATAAAPLSVRAVLAPAPLADLADLVLVPEVFEPMLVEYMVGRAEMKDDEHANSGRAAALLERFTTGVKSLAA